MDPSKRERVFLLGVVPVVAAIAGSVVTVLATHYMQDSQPSDAIVAIIQDNSLSAAEKEKLIGLVNSNSDRFYSILTYAMSALTIFTGVTSWAVADWIRKW